MPQALVEESRRAVCYKALAQCYYPPDQDMLDALRRPDPAAPQSVRTMGEQADAVDDLETLRIDHARLFVGPYKLLAPPYGSVYLEENRLMGESALDVQAIYAETGLDVVIHGPPDHISIEMEFLYALVLKEMAALHNSDIQARQAWREKQRQFLSVHLGRWVAPFTDRVLQGADTDFYRALARLTREFVENDLAELAGAD